MRPQVTLWKRNEIINKKNQASCQVPNLNDYFLIRSAGGEGEDKQHMAVAVVDPCVSFV